VEIKRLSGEAAIPTVFALSRKKIYAGLGKAPGLEMGLTRTVETCLFLAEVSVATLSRITEKEERGGIGSGRVRLR